MTMLNPFKMLGIALDASETDIKQAYRKAALLNHPDKVGNTSEATAKMVAINASFGILTDPLKRAQAIADCSPRPESPSDSAWTPGKYSTDHFDQHWEAAEPKPPKPQREPRPKPKWRPRRTYSVHPDYPRAWYGNRSSFPFMPGMPASAFSSASQDDEGYFSS